MKLSYKGIKSVTVYANGKFYNFINGTIEVSKEESKELLKNKNISVFKEEIKEEIEEKETEIEEKTIENGQRGKK